MENTVDKQELIDWITKLDDPAMLKTIQSLKDDTQQISWDDLPEKAKAGIERGLADSKAGRVTPHEEVRKIYKKWL